MLSRLELSNFKSFREVGIDLGSLVLIVGTNASGKSNLRDALRFLQGIGLGYRLSDILGDVYGPGGILQWRGIRGGVREVAFSGETVISLRCMLPPFPYRGYLAWLAYRIDLDVSDQGLGARVVRERLGTPVRYFWDSHAPDEPAVQKGEHQIRVRHPRGGQHRAHGKISEYSSALPVICQLPNRKDEPASARAACTQVLEAFSSIRFLDLDPDAIRTPSQPGQTILGDRGENLSSVLQGICQDPKNKAVLLSWLRALTPMDAVDFEFKTDFTGKVLVYLVEQGGRSLSAYSASDGTLRFLAMIAALLSPDTGRIYFFEELDNGIHPTRLHLLLSLIQQVSQQQKIQVIGTTHNPALLAFLEQPALESALLVYRHEGTAESRIRRIMDLPDIARVLQGQSLGYLHQTGWLENAAFFSDPDEPEIPEADDDEDIDAQGCVQ